MLPVPFIKLGAQIVCGLGSAKIVNDIIRNHVTITSTTDVVKVWMGSLVISSMVVEQSSRYIDRVTTELSDFVANRKTEETTSEVVG